MAAADRDKNELKKNWFCGATGLVYLQEGLKNVVHDKVLQCRDDSVQKLTSSPRVSLNQCKQCTALNLLPEHADPQTACCKSKGKCIQSNPIKCFGSKQPKGRRKCPKGICSKLYDAIVDEHCFADPLWNNTDPTTWTSDRYGWSFAKCFQTTPNKGTSADTTDAAGLLSILLRNKSIQNWLACKDMRTYTTKCPFYQTRDIRNEILHSPKFELEEQTLNDYLDAFIKVLQDPKCLILDEGSKQAVAKLKQLKENKKYSPEDETTLLQMHENALLELAERKTEALKEVKEAGKEAKQDIEETGEKIKHDIQHTTEAALSEINAAKEDGIKQIRKQNNMVTGPAGAESLPLCETELSYKADAGLHDPECNQVLDKAKDTLLGYMDPDGIHAYFTEINITKNQTPRQKNRCILGHAKANGKTGYANLKNFLRGTNQSTLDEILECIENDEDTSSLETRVKDETDKRKRFKG